MPFARRQSIHFAAAVSRSAAAISGRRSSSVDGTPCGTTGMIVPRAAGGIEKFEAGRPINVAIACSSSARGPAISANCALALSTCTSARAHRLARRFCPSIDPASASGRCDAPTVSRSFNFAVEAAQAQIIACQFGFEAQSHSREIGLIACASALRTTTVSRMRPQRSTS